MPWCPTCKSEYRAGVTNCSECNAELVDQLEQIDETKVYDKEAYLTSVKGGIEASVLESLLNSNNIPVLKKYKESGGFLSIYMGDTNSGIDLFVPSDMLEEAKSIIDKDSKLILNNEYIESIEEEEAFNMESQKLQKRRSLRAWILMLFFIPGIVFIITYIILMIIEK